MVNWRKVVSVVRYEFENVLVVSATAFDYLVENSFILLDHVIEFFHDPIVQMLFVYGVLFCIVLYL